MTKQAQVGRRKGQAQAHGREGTQPRAVVRIVATAKDERLTVPKQGWGWHFATVLQKLVGHDFRFPQPMVRCRQEVTHTYGSGESQLAWVRPWNMGDKNQKRGDVPRDDN